MNMLPKDDPKREASLAATSAAVNLDSASPYLAAALSARALWNCAREVKYLALIYCLLNHYVQSEYGDELT